MLEEFRTAVRFKSKMFLLSWSAPGPNLSSAAFESEMQVPGGAETPRTAAIKLGSGGGLPMKQLNTLPWHLTSQPWPMAPGCTLWRTISRQSRHY